MLTTTRAAGTDLLVTSLQRPLVKVFESFILLHRYFLACFLEKVGLRDCFSFFPWKGEMLEKDVSSHF